jgi:glycosyltransferase involved in cell wall biosynthesis
MSDPQLSIIIPTYNRPHLVQNAVASALAQTYKAIEVLVVDDCSPQPLTLPSHPQLRVLRLPHNQGGAAARNFGAKQARGRWITYLDDDDELLPEAIEISLNALSTAALPPPVGVLSGIAVINADGETIQTRFPPTLAKGSYFGLEEIEPGQSFFCKQTLVIEREILLDLGGFDESFGSRVHSELFLRLNLACSLLGVPQVTYKLYDRDGDRISRNPALRQQNFHRLVSKHYPLFAARPKQFADFIYNHAIALWQQQQRGLALKTLAWALRVHPWQTVARLGSPLKRASLKALTAVKS